MMIPGTSWAGFGPAALYFGDAMVEQCFQTRPAAGEGKSAVATYSSGQDGTSQLTARPF